MVRKEFLKLMQENLMILDRMLDRLKTNPVRDSGYPRQLLSILLRLNRGGRALLKDIARREGISTPNLCAAFRRLERDGLVVRAVDEADRRNVWYECTDAGRAVANKAAEGIRRAICELFASMDADEEMQMRNSLKTMNDVLRKLELK